MDTFALQIRFRCLCFFVPEPAMKRMHVLMPDTRTHACSPPGSPPGCVDEHVVRIIYPVPFGGSLDRDLKPTSKPELGVFQVLPMEEFALVLGRGSGGASMDLPIELVDITPNAGPVDETLLSWRRHPDVISRITLEGGQLIAHRSGAKWLFNGDELDIAQEIIWTIPNLPGPSLEWSRTRLKPAGEPPQVNDLEKLPSISATNGIVRLDVHHVVAVDFPTPGPGDPNASSAHFAAYYNLPDYPSSIDLPVFIKKNETNTLTCMSGRGQLR